MFRLTLKIRSLNGGYKIVRNYNNGPPGSLDSKQYYICIERMHIASFTFDFEYKYHCSLTSQCTDNKLNVGLATTKMVNISINMTGE